jgi:hypothetical protein
MLGAFVPTVQSSQHCIDLRVARGGLHRTPKSNCIHAAIANRALGAQLQSNIGAGVDNLTIVGKMSSTALWEHGRGAWALQMDRLGREG